MLNVLKGVCRGGIAREGVQARLHSTQGMCQYEVGEVWAPASTLR